MGFKKGQDGWDIQRKERMPRNEYTRCQYVSSQGVECHKWFLVDGGKYCPELHRNIPNAHDKENFMALVQGERDLCYKMSNEELEDHIRKIEAELEAYVQTKKTVLASARAVRAEREAKMTEEERKELRKIRVAKDAKPNSKASKPKVDKATEMSNKLGVSRKDLLSLDMASLMAKFNQSKGPNDNTTSQGNSSEQRSEEKSEESLPGSPQEAL